MLQNVNTSFIIFKTIQHVKSKVSTNSPLTTNSVCEGCEGRSEVTGLYTTGS